MRFKETAIAGAYLIELMRFKDERGSFARVWSLDVFHRQGLVADFVEWNTSRTRRAGTIRGLHFQQEPHREAKLIRCTRGALYDVILDLREDSPSFLRWEACELSETEDRLLYLPPGCAHGFQSLADDTEIFYASSCRYSPAHERGIRWNDPFFSIRWPLADRPRVSTKDARWPAFEKTASPWT